MGLGVGRFVIQAGRCAGGSGVGCGHCVGVAVKDDVGTLLRFCDVGGVVFRRACWPDGSGIGCGHCVGATVEADVGKLSI